MRGNIKINSFMKMLFCVHNVYIKKCRQCRREPLYGDTPEYQRQWRRKNHDTAMNYLKVSEPWQCPSCSFSSVWKSSIYQHCKRNPSHYQGHPWRKTPPPTVTEATKPRQNRAKTAPKLTVKKTVAQNDTPAKK